MFGYGKIFFGPLPDLTLSFQLSQNLLLAIREEARAKFVVVDYTARRGRCRVRIGGQSLSPSTIEQETARRFVNVDGVVTSAIIYS